MQGSELKALRKATGLSQAELADAVGLTSTYVGMMEREQKAIEPRTEAAARFLLDRFWVGQAKDGRYTVARKTVRELPHDTAMFYSLSELMLYGVFGRRDHAYRWAAALRQSKSPRNTRKLLRERAADARRRSREG
jgi:transcriptional regulator with XRE-family HTH domain